MYKKKNKRKKRSKVKDYGTSDSGMSIQAGKNWLKDYIKGHPERWAKLMDMEKRINDLTNKKTEPDLSKPGLRGMIGEPATQMYQLKPPALGGSLRGRNNQEISSHRGVGLKVRRRGGKIDNSGQRFVAKQYGGKVI